MKRFLKANTIVSAVLGIVVFAISFATGYKEFGIGFIVSIPLGVLALLFLSKDVERMVSERKGIFFAPRFIFRLACFAILLYLLLVKLKLSPLGVSLGLTAPVFCSIGVILFYANRKNV